MMIMFSALRSGLVRFFVQIWNDRTKTGPHIFTTWKRPDWTNPDRSVAVFSSIIKFQSPSGLQNDKFFKNDGTQGCLSVNCNLFGAREHPLARNR